MKVAKAKKKGKLLLNKVNHTVSDVTRDIDRYITKKPFRTMGIIMLAGICIGFVIKRQ